jgi:ABC-type uncharacterized transport system ATPase subunit
MIPLADLQQQPKYDAILKEKTDYYGETKAAYQFAAEEFARQYHEWMDKIIIDDISKFIKNLEEEGKVYPRMWTKDVIKLFCHLQGMISKNK